MKVVVYTCITNGYDDVSPPGVSTQGVDYLCFNDGSIKVPPPWQDVKIDPTYSGKDANRFIKILPHLNNLLKYYDLTIYIDGAIVIAGDLTPLIQQVQCAEGQTFMYEHPVRNCIYLEAISCVANMQAPLAETSRLLARYRKEGMPEAFGLFEAGVIIRKAGSEFERLLVSWWQAYLDGVGRDQLALMYSSWKTGVAINSLGRADHRFEQRFFSCKSGHKSDFIKRHFVWWIWRPIIRALIDLKIVKL
jgi:hypothetical protein